MSPDPRLRRRDPRARSATTRSGCPGSLPSIRRGDEVLLVQALRQRPVDAGHRHRGPGGGAGGRGRARGDGGDRRADPRGPARLHVRARPDRARQRRPGVLPRPHLRLHLARGRGPRRRRRVDRGALVADRRACPPMGEVMLARIEAALSDEREARFVAAESDPAPTTPEPTAPRRATRAHRPGPRSRRLPRRLGRRAARPRPAGRAVFVAPHHHRAGRAGGAERRRGPSWRSTSPSACPTAADARPTPRLAGCWSASRRRSSPPRPAPRSRQTTYAEGREANLAATGGRTSVSAQAYALREKVLQVDAWVRSRPGVRVIEVHPEVSFARMAGAPCWRARRTPTESRCSPRGAGRARHHGARPSFARRRLRRGRPARRVRGGLDRRTSLARRRRVVPGRPGGLLRRHPRRDLGVRPSVPQPECVRTP